VKFPYGTERMAAGFDCFEPKEGERLKGPRSPGRPCNRPPSNWCGRTRAHQPMVCPSRASLTPRRSGSPTDGRWRRCQPRSRRRWGHTLCLWDRIRGGCHVQRHV